MAREQTDQAGMNETHGSRIEFIDVRKVYAEGGNSQSARPAAIDGVSLRIEPGEFVVLLGPSGCGKTTLLKLINRLIEPDAGRIEIDGADTLARSAVQLRRGIGYVIQQSGLFPHLRVRDNVAVVPSLLKWPKAQTRQRVDELLDLVGLPPDSYANRYPSQLSGGEQQRVGLARALAASPSTMLMDEPFGALDAITRTRLQNEVQRIHREFNQTIVFVTHDIEEAVKLATRIVVMRAGRIVQVGTPAEIISAPADSFVADLVGAEDTWRRLGLMPIHLALQPLSSLAEAAPRLDDSASLRDGLAMLVETSAPALTIVDAAGTPLGEITLTSVQAAAGQADLVAKD